ncbi:response regulator [Myxacorys almedinensis]|uniref:Response regulator n=1 Tax=Myxacorys almedinensis A TaxID=2690445 RepID=A0A8J7Z8S7_9CYAN|nr:response regulator [Myxacorys almedinensis]NDJ17535.1 response regulator [Myxacorys almedinensis A]
MCVSSRKPLILAVDDNEDNLFLLRYQLQDTIDCSLITAMDGKSALALIESEMPDLVLLDIVLPDMNGMEVARRIRECQKTIDLPIVALTASARQEDRDRILESGCNDYLSKPYDLDDLEKVIHQHLQRHLLCSQPL